jgi:protein SCO1/2
MPRMTRRDAITVGGLSAVAGLGALTGRELGPRKEDTRPRFQPAGPGSARALIQQRHLPNLPLVTHHGQAVRFYDDLIKDKKVVLTFVSTQARPESRKVAENLTALKRFFGARVGTDIFMYSITRNPEHDTPEMLNAWVRRYAPAASSLFAGPGWQFLTGRPTDVEGLRRSLGFISPDPAEDTDPAYSIGLLRYGVEPEMRWAHCESQATPRVLAHSLLLDFGTDPTDPDPPPIFNCRILAARI